MPGKISCAGEKKTPAEYVSERMIQGCSRIAKKKGRELHNFFDMTGDCAFRVNTDGAVWIGYDFFMPDDCRRSPGIRAALPVLPPQQ